MHSIPADLRQQLSSPDPLLREEAARALRAYPGLEPLRLLTHLLSDERHEVVYAAGQSLLSIGSRETVAELIPLLRSEDVRLRNLVVEIIGRIGPAAIPQIGQLLEDRDKDIRKFAVETLKLIHAPEAEDCLIQALFDDNINVAAEAAEALGSIGTQRAVPCLIECLERDAWLQCAALKSLGKIGGDDALTAVLETNPHAEGIVLFCAVSALGDIADDRGLDFLLTLLEGDRAALESSVIPAIEAILEHADAETIHQVKTRLPARRVIALLSNENQELVRSAISLLGIFKEESAVEELTRLYSKSDRPLFDDLDNAFQRIRPERMEPIVKILKHDREPESVKIAAIRLIVRIGRKESYKPLADCLSACDAGLKIEIIAALAALQEKKALPALHALLDTNASEIQLAVIDALKTFGDPSSIPFLTALSADPDHSVRRQAAKSLRKYDLGPHRETTLSLLQGSAPQALAFGLEMIADDCLPEFEADILRLCRNQDATVSAIALERAGALKTELSYALLGDALTDENPQIRLTAIRGLERYPERDVGMWLLQAAQSDPVEWNRYEAVQILGRLGLAQMLTELVLLLESAPDLVKTAVLDVLGDLGGQEHQALIATYTQARNDLVKDAAFAALKKCEARNSEA